MFENHIHAKVWPEIIPIGNDFLLQNQVVPEDKGKLSAFTPASEKVYLRTRALMEAGITDETWATDLKILNHYKACMDQVGYYLLFIENLKAYQ